MARDPWGRQKPERSLGWLEERTQDRPRRGNHSAETKVRQAADRQTLLEASQPRIGRGARLALAASLLGVTVVALATEADFLIASFAAGWALILISYEFRRFLPEHYGDYLPLLVNAIVFVIIGLLGSLFAIALLIGWRPFGTGEGSPAIAVILLFPSSVAFAYFGAKLIVDIHDASRDDGQQDSE